jgi:SpoIID/LytB domain protein
MRLTRTIVLSFALLGAVVFSLNRTVELRAAEHGVFASAQQVGVLKSDASFVVSSWIGRWETDAAIDLLRSLGLDVRILSDADLASGSLDGIGVLVVPNARCISRAGARQVAAFVAQGGRLLATEMASYRDEHNHKVGETNDFQWATLYDADFQRWLNAYPRCEYLSLDKTLGAETAAVLGMTEPLRRIELGRNQAMLVTARPTADVLAGWLDADGETPTSDAGATAAALTQSHDGRVIYCGENLLAPELSRSPQVRALVLALLLRLQTPHAPHRLPAALAGVPATFEFPRSPVVNVAASGPLLRVGVLNSIPLLGVSGASGIEVNPLGTAMWTWRAARATGGQSVQAAAGQVLRIEAMTSREGSYLAVRDDQGEIGRCNGALRVTGTDDMWPVQTLQLRPDGCCKVAAWRGAIELDPHGSHMTMVNVLSVEQYVAGVVPNEVPGNYPSGALQTMAVIARTFSLARRGFHEHEGYDVCSTVHCQMYGGYLSEWEAGNQATLSTQGEVIEYDHALADSTFHAVCGGIGEDVDKVWPQHATPYLIGELDAPPAVKVPDLSDERAFRSFIDNPPEAYCSASPRFRWQESYSTEQLQTLFEQSLPVTLGTAFHGLGQLRDVRVGSRSSHGRVQQLDIEGTEGSYSIAKDSIRWLWSGGHLGQGGLQSTLFCIDKQGATYVFKGGGWGHGVGMCQDGAAGMAARGIPYHDILLHYYPHTSLAHLAASTLSEKVETHP